ncbi:PepSY-associated TM helix domain-containing protein [Rhodoblastus sp.]|uniref:PepSY-associated TM helix domain-containing protein n=1 Tax=Rhodoblastus sp. TaxID=1962975 RepID=UPI003F960B34
MIDRTAEGGIEKNVGLEPPIARRQEFGRKVFLQIHRTIGLFAGAILVLVGLSGSVLAFREDIDEWLNAPLMRVETPVQASYRPLDEILAAAAATMPPEAKAERLTLPRHSGAAAAITYIAETDDLDTYSYEMFVDPYTAKVTGQRLLLHGDSVLSQPLVPIVMAFHWTLLLGPNNAYIVGAVGAFVFLSVLAGLYLWWPRNGDWRLGLKIKLGASPERVVYDLHRSVGAYLGAVLLVMLFTGVAMIFKPATRSVVSQFSPLRADPDFGKSTPIPGKMPIGVEAAVGVADEVFPDGRLHWILLPSSPTGVYVVGKQASEEPNRTKTYRNVGVDQYSGRILHVQDRRKFTAGETFLEWLFPLHSGEAFGAIGRPLALVIGLAPLTLYTTGFIRWWQKRRARKRQT